MNLGVLNDKIEEAMKVYLETVPTIPAHEFITREEWYETCGLPAFRINKMKAAISEFGDANDILPSDFIYGCFGKDEEYVEQKPIRGIFGQCERLKALFGPMFTIMEKFYFKTRNSIKGIDMLDMPQHIYECIFSTTGNSRVTDYSSLEKSHKEIICLLIIFRVYLKLCAAHADSLEKLDLVSKTRANMKFDWKGFTVFVEWALGSGCRDTSFANFILNDFFCWFTMWMRNVPEDDEKHVCEGDDAGQQVQALTNIKLDTAFLKTAGLNMTFEVFDSVLHGGFCGMTMDDLELQLITDPVRMLLRFGWLPARYAGARIIKHKALYRMKALSLILIFPSCPVIATFCNRVLWLTRDIDHRLALRMESSSYMRTHYEEVDSVYQCLLRKGMANGGMIETPEPGPSTRLLFARQFGMSIDWQFRIEQVFRNLTFGNIEMCLFDVYCDTRSSVWREASETYVVEEGETFTRPPIIDHDRINQLRAQIVGVGANPANLGPSGHTPL